METGTGLVKVHLSSVGNWQNNQIKYLLVIQVGWYLRQEPTESNLKVSCTTRVTT